jgi:hypothetical protein
MESGAKRPRISIDVQQPQIRRRLRLAAAKRDLTIRRYVQQAIEELRPALVVSSSAYNRGRKEVVVAAITGNVRRRLLGGHLIVDWKGAGLLFPSVATGTSAALRRARVIQ